MESVCHSMIIEYLVHNCFKKTAKALIKEATKVHHEYELGPSCIDNEVQWSLLDARKTLFEAVSQGDIANALEIIKHCFPKVAAYDLLPIEVFPIDNPEANLLQNIMFELKCQQFIEIIRPSNVNLAEPLEYAKNHLKPVNERHRELLHEVTTLMAYPHPHLSEQARFLLSQERRDRLAEQVNNIVLGQCNLPTETRIEKVSKQYSIVAQELASFKTAFTKPNQVEKPSI